jgi:quinol monooxygenase YgiN
VIVISGVMEIPSESVDRFTEISRDLCAATVQEPGCAAYTFARSIVDPERFEIFEEWADQDALDAHTRADHYRAWGRALRELSVRRMSIVRYDTTERSVLA